MSTHMSAHVSMRMSTHISTHMSIRRFSANNFGKSLVTAIGFFLLPLAGLSVKICLPLATAIIGGGAIVVLHCFVARLN